MSMNNYYQVTQLLYDALVEDEIVNTVTKGSISIIDTYKHVLSPAAHVMINSIVEPTENIIACNVSVICMGIVDESKESTTDKYKGNDDMDDVLNMTFAVLQRLVNMLRAGEYATVTQIDGAPSYESFEERFENKWAGWAVTFDLILPSAGTIC